MNLGVWKFGWNVTRAENLRIQISEGVAMEDRGHRNFFSLTSSRNFQISKYQMSAKKVVARNGPVGVGTNVRMFSGIQAQAHTTLFA